MRKDGTLDEFDRDREEFEDRVQLAKQAPLDLRAVEAQESGGVCCACGYSGTKETPCRKREDKTHCEHWWDGSDSYDLPLLKTEDALCAFEYTGSDGMQTLVHQLYRAFRHTRDERDALLAHCRALTASLVETANLLEAIYREVETDADHELVNKMTFQWLREKAPQRLKRAAAVLAQATDDP